MNTQGKKLKYELDEKVVMGILEFIGRTQLQGKEVEAFNVCVNALRNPITEEKEVTNGSGEKK